MRVVFLILDGLPRRHVSTRLTPTLAALAAEGAMGTGRACMTSATYPNHATFATGTDPVNHGVVANLLVDGAIQMASAVGPKVPTLFDACRTAGRSSAAVVGDQHLIGVMGATGADDHWPPKGELPAGTVCDAHGYAADAEVAPRLAAVLAQPFDLVIGHLNEPDTAGHDLGPDSSDAAGVYHSTDAALAVALEGLRPQWDDSVVIVVSDHDQEMVDLELDPIDLYGPLAAAGLPLIAVPEGSGAVVWGDDPDGGAWLDRVDGVVGHEEILPGARVVWGGPGRWFALPPGFDADPLRGQHGGACTREQVAVVAGGHPAARQLAAAVAGRTIEAADWAPTVAALLALELPGATGRSHASPTQST